MIIVITAIISFIMILSVAAVGGHFSERAGVVNLSIEAFMTIGAISYALIAGRDQFIDNKLNQFWIMPFAALCTALFAIIYATITVKLKANQTIAGIALNIFALAFAIYLIQSKANPGGPRSNVQIQQGLFSLGKSNSSIGWVFNITLFLGIPTLIFGYLFLNKTKFGTKIRACGEAPHAAASLGIKVERTQFIAIIIAGGISGLAGSFFAQVGNSFNGSTQGLGFLAVAIVIFGQWKTLLIIAGATLFGTLYGLASQIDLIPALAKIPQELFQMVPFVFSLIVLVFTQKGSHVPKALGIPYINSGR